jgi:hypothetical protein
VTTTGTACGDRTAHRDSRKNLPDPHLFSRRVAWDGPPHYPAGAGFLPAQKASGIAGCATRIVSSVVHGGGPSTECGAGRRVCAQLCPNSAMVGRVGAGIENEAL